jgi:2,4-didehydro-3-deoxy-L-rhamnonate hydrolase
MPINVVRFEFEGRPRWGVLRKDQVTPLDAPAESTGSFVRSADVAQLSAVQGPTLNLRELRLLSPVTRTQQFLCQGANYRQHMIESGLDPDQKRYNMIFTKASSCIVPADHDLIVPPVVKLLDYEIELGLVLKRDILGPVTVTADSLHEWVAGLVIVNDYSARDIQLPETQFYKGKSFRTFGPVGPHLCLLAREDFAQLGALQLRLEVDGEVRQDDTTANLVNKPAETLTELSSVQDMFAGDLLSTGTPSGCALAPPPPWKQKFSVLISETQKWEIFVSGQLKRSQYLRPGQVVTATIKSADGSIDLGKQTNRVVAAGARS